MEKWPILAQNNRLTPLEKCQYFDFFNFLFLQARKAVFFLEHHKTHFPGLYCQNTKRWKISIFGPKPCTNPFGKNVNFSTFLTSCFYSLERRFFFQNILKGIFLAYIAGKNTVQKWTILDQNQLDQPLWKNVIISTF